MKISLKFLFTLSVIALMVACGKDDDNEPSGDDKFTFDGTAYTMVDGVVSDYGSGDPTGGDGADSHYNYDFTIADADFAVITGDGDPYLGAGDATTILVYIELFSSGTSGFNTGTFTYMDEDTNSSSSDIAGKNFFYSGEVELDSDGVENGDLDGPEYGLTGGSVTVTGSGPTNYTLTFDLQTSGGNLTGTYSGPFTFESDDD